MTHQVPVKDMPFVINKLADLDNVAKLPGFEDATTDTVQVMLEGSARLTGEVVASLNVEDDRNPNSWKDGIVTTTTGFKEVSTQSGQGSWQGVQHPLEYGGQDLSKLITTVCIEMLNAASLSFVLCPLLTDGVIEALLTAGAEEQEQLLVPRLIPGEWTDTINLTEPQAGSDLASIRTRAEPMGDGTFKIFDTRTLIT